LFLSFPLFDTCENRKPESERNTRVAKKVRNQTSNTKESPLMSNRFSDWGFLFGRNRWSGFDAAANGFFLFLLLLFSLASSFFWLSEERNNVAVIPHRMKPNGMDGAL
jgi:hypothetical protein